VRKVFHFLWIALLAAVSFSAQASPNYLYVTGEGYVTQGSTKLLSSSEGYSFVPYSLYGGVYLDVSNFYPGMDMDSFRVYSLLLMAPGGKVLTEGFYGGATRAPFQAQGAPGLDFSMESRGDNQLKGWFDILDIAFSSSNVVSRLAVDFYQDDENGYAGHTFGSLRFNSDIPPTTIPEPSSLALLSLCFVGFFVAGKTGRSRHPG